MKSKIEFEAISYEENNEISQSIISHHGVFYQFWQLVRPRYTNSKKYPTACVVFNRENNCIDFIINKKFWNKRTAAQKTFIICHECLHVMLEHGSRASSTLAKINPVMVNACLDIPINEMLVKYFDFNRKEIDKRNKFCWANTVFKEKDVPNDKSYEYYFNKFKNDPDTQEISMCGMGSEESGDGELETNSHENLNSFNNEDAKKQIEDLIDSLSDEEKESLKDIAQRIDRNSKDGDSKNGKMAGTGSGGLTKIMGNIKPKPKRKWESIIKKWSQKITRKERDQTHWISRNRRASSICSDMFLPSEMEHEIKKNSGDKIDVWMFLDTSGSCIDLAPRFWKASRSLPADKFNVKYHCFDTEVFKLNETDVKEGKLYGFMGTSFIALESFIQQTIKKEGKRYSNIGAVFVITDGYGDYIKPEKPKKWYWFLSTDCKEYIPRDSHIFSLKEFE
jgi:predicted metal-dependent peptidase